MKLGNRKRKRHERDLDAGLLFSWRVPGGSLGRTAVGLVTAVGLFGAMASMVKVQIPFAEGEIRQAAEVLVLDPDDPDARELLDWARYHSPFPDRWEPASTGTLEAMMGEVTRDLERKARYEPRLWPLLTTEKERILPGLIDGTLPPLPAPAPGLRQTPPEPAVVVEVVARAGGDLTDRWGIRSLLRDGEELAPHLGRSASFMVAVDQGGRVVHCLPMEGLGEEVAPWLEGWIRGQVVDSVPGQDELAWGLVEIRLHPVVLKTGGES